MRARLGAFVMVMSVISGMLGGASIACDDLRAGPTGKVVDVIDGDTLLLADGAKVRLLGVQAPKLAQGREYFEDWPLANEAQFFLQDLVLGKEVSLKYGQAETDRYGRLLAHAFVQTEQSEVWVNQEIVAKGMGRVYSLADNRLCLEPLYRAEAQARVEKYGVWSNNFYGLRRAENSEQLEDLVGQFELVEGAIVSANKAGGRVYLNFGEDWVNDFTVIIEAPALRMFAAAAIDPILLRGALVRVRGWVDVYGGPRIFVTHPEQLELLAR